MNTFDTDDERPSRSGSRDLDAIAARMAASRPQQGERNDDEAERGQAARADGARTRDAARIRTLMDRSPSQEQVTTARGYASSIPGVTEGVNAEEAPVAGDPYPHARTHGSAGTAPMRFPRQEEIDDLAKPLPAAPTRRLARSLAVAVTVVAGLVIALGAYAGGGEYISGLIGGDSPARPAARARLAEAAPAPVLSDSALSAADSAEHAAQLATFGESLHDTIRRAPFGSGRVATIVPVARPKLGDTLRPRLEGDAPRVPAASHAKDAAKPTKEPAKEVAAKADAPKAGPARTDAAKSDAAKSGAAAKPASRYLVQVRATPDRAEADRVAARLRSRGAGGVSVSSTTKEGKTVYRVRYGSFASEAEARTSARSVGHADAWVVRR